MRALAASFLGPLSLGAPYRASKLGSIFRSRGEVDGAIRYDIAENRFRDRTRDKS